jgi:dipeptidyl-peptidase-4
MPKPQLLLLLPLVFGLSAFGQKKPVTLEAVTSAPARDGFTPIWSPSGDQFVYNERDVLRLFDCKSAKVSEIIRLTRLRDAAAKSLTPGANDWTNRRVSAEPVQWFPSGKQLLVSEDGDLFIVPLDGSAFTQLTSTPESEDDAKLSPDGKLVGFRRGHDLYSLRLQDRQITRLTSNGSETLLNGEMDWVYPEELELSTAWWWSPDSSRIAYMQFDISREPIFPQVSLLDSRAKPEPERYPQPGDPNADVRIGIVPPSGGSTRWMDLGDTRDHLLARVEWLPSSREIAVERLNRIQNRLDLLIADAASGQSRVLLHEEDPYWINVNNHLHFFADGKQFLWGSERDGFLHLYLYGMDGKLERQMTHGDWQVEQVLGIDEHRKTVFYQSSEPSPLESQFYSISLNGEHKQRLSTAAGSHSIHLSPSFAWWTDSFSSLDAPPRTTVYSKEGKELAVLRKPDTSYADYDLQTPEILSFHTADGTLLYGRLIKPAGFTAGRKYPVVVQVYGGPGSQAVRNRWLGISWEQALAQKGFVVWQVDNRGSLGRGHQFESAIFRDMGEHELADQLAGLDYLNSLGFIDSKRVGIYGWSYGGFMTLYSLCHAPDRFQAGVAGAPVTNWRTYDSIYTERYMGLPADNPEAYDKTSPIAHAADLKAQLLILHNIEDDNVHFQNTVRMAAALEHAGKRFSMVVYPQKTHGVTGPERRQMLESIAGFFEQTLKP